jgi:hypothetical protein
MRTMAACFKRVGKIHCGKLRLKINLRTGIKISEQTLIINAGTPSSPTDFDGHRHFIVYRTYEAATEAIGWESDDQKSVESCACSDYQTLLKYAAQALQLHMAGSDHFHQSQVQCKFCHFF